MRFYSSLKKKLVIINAMWLFDFKLLQDTNIFFYDYAHITSILVVEII